MTNVIENQNQPLASLDEWEDDLLRRYPNPEDIATSKATEAYRNYEEPAREAKSSTSKTSSFSSSRSCARRRTNRSASEVP